MEVNTTDLVVLVLVLLIKQILNLVLMLVFYSSMLRVMKYVRGVLVVITIAVEILFAFSLSIELAISGLFLRGISLLEVLTSLSFIPFDYREQH